MKNFYSLALAAISLVGAQVIVQAAESAPATKTKSDDSPAREQSIYVPYEKLWQVFEKQGRGVFLPYEAFMELWRAAEEQRPRPLVVEPPVDALITEVTGEATVTQDVVLFKAGVKIEVLKKGWHQVPIRLNDVAITRALLAGEPARLLRDEEGGYELLIEQKSDRPEIIQLELEFAKSYIKAPGRNSVGFQCPLAPVSRWDVRIPEPGVEVDIHPLLAATDVPDKEAADQTRVLAFVGATPEVRIEWTPKAEGAKGLKALANVKTEHELVVDEGVMRNRVKLTYDISRAEVSQLAVEVPRGHKVVNVFDPNVREWSVEDKGDIQQITAQLFESVKGSQSLIIELERFADEAEVRAPLVKALDVGRQQGVVVVRLGAGLRAETASRDGLLQLDAEELPPHLARGGWQFSYRYAALPFSLALNVEKVQPRILVDSLVEVHLRPEELTIDLTALYDVQRAGIFRLDLQIPENFEVRQVRGVSHGSAKAVQVDGYHRAEKDASLLTVNLSRKAQGRVGLTVSLHRALEEPDLLTPTGKSVAIPVSLPRARAAEVERENGRIVVYGPESLRVNPADVKGMRSISFNEATRDMVASPRLAGERPVQAFAFTDADASLELSAERRAPQVTVSQLLVARIESGVVKYEETFFYDVLYSGVKSLRIDVPTEQVERIRITTAAIRHAALEGDEKPQDLAADHTAWRIEGETEFMGRQSLHMQWEEKIERLDIGQTVRLSVPRLLPRGVDRAWGQIVLAKAETIDVAPTSELTGLRAIDPRYDLMAGANVKDAARAFEFHADWSLAVDATRYEPKEVKATSIERGLVRFVVTRSDVTSVQAVYRMRSARQRLVIRLPGEVSFDTQPVRINGRPVSLEQGEQGEYFVPLVTQEQGTPFLLELRYVIARAGSRLMGPEFPNEPAVQQVYLSAYVPRDRVYTGSLGDWNDEMVWVVKGFNAWPRGTQNPDQLIRWVTDGIEVDQGTLSNFAVDGRHLLFSTLRPALGKAGALRIMTVRGWVLQVSLIALMVVVGLVLLPVPLARRAIVVGAALVLLVLLGVFTPSLARGVVNNATAAAGFIVLVIWVLWFFLVSLPRSPAWQERKQVKARKNAPPPLPAADRSAELLEGGEDRD